MPFWTVYAGIITFISSAVLITWVLVENPHAESSVRIQNDRGYAVVASGELEACKGQGVQVEEHIVLAPVTVSSVRDLSHGELTSPHDTLPACESQGLCVERY
jgi:hypothetical protein